MGLLGKGEKPTPRPTRLESPQSIYLPRQEFTLTAPAQKEARQPAPDPGFISHPHPHTSHLHTSHQLTCLQHTHLHLHPAPHLCTLTSPHIPHLHTFIPHPQLHRSHLYPTPQTCTHHTCITHPRPLTPLTCASPTQQAPLCYFHSLCPGAPVLGAGLLPVSSAPTSVCSCLEGQSCGISPTITAHHLCLPSKCSPTPHLPKASSCGPGGRAPDEPHSGWQVPGLSHYPEHPPTSPPSCKELLGGCTASPTPRAIYHVSSPRSLSVP